MQKGFSRKIKVHIHSTQPTIAEKISSCKLQKGRFEKLNAKSFAAKSLFQKNRFHFQYFYPLDIPLHLPMQLLIVKYNKLFISIIDGWCAYEHTFRKCVESVTLKGLIQRSLVWNYVSVTYTEKKNKVALEDKLLLASNAKLLL